MDKNGKVNIVFVIRKSFLLNEYLRNKYFLHECLARKLIVIKDNNYRFSTIFKSRFSLNFQRDKYELINKSKIVFTCDFTYRFNVDINYGDDL